MKVSDYLAAIFFVGFGLWLIVFPANVIRFYNWFRRRQVIPFDPPRVRLAGAIWVFLAIVVLFFTFRNN